MVRGAELLAGRKGRAEQAIGHFIEPMACVAVAQVPCYSVDVVLIIAGCGPGTLTEVTLSLGRVEPHLYGVLLIQNLSIVTCPEMTASVFQRKL